MKRLTVVAVLAFYLLAFLKTANAQPYQDLTHESQVFGHKKFYRLYLPDNYAKSGKRYPVIYFFHGWGGRHFKDDNANLEYEKLQELVNKYQVIMVM
jgi:predicted peptidase